MLIPWVSDEDTDTDCRKDKVISTWDEQEENTYDHGNEELH